MAPAHAVPGGTIAWDVAATASQQAAGEPRVALFLTHWSPHAVSFLPPISVHIVVAGTLVDPPYGVVGGFRDLQTGEVWLTYETDGTVVATEWEIPLMAQGRLDPTQWTWAKWGPLFPGQDAAAATWTAGP